jgi:SAM-dependent methyltransferase
VSPISCARGPEHPGAAGPRLPGELGVEETLRFLVRVLPPAPVRVLEVGCGDGAVAHGLAAAGYDVTGVDEADFLHYESSGVFDALLFTRSLHHMSPVGTALGKAHAILASGGLIVAEELAYDRVNIQTARWLYDLESVLIAAALFAAAPGGAADESGPDAISTPAAATEGNPLGRWRWEHAAEPPLATGHAILAAARERFELTVVEEAPYLYRYLCERLEPTERGLRIGRRTLELESRLIRERDIAAAGLRFVGRMGG